MDLTPAKNPLVESVNSLEDSGDLGKIEDSYYTTSLSKVPFLSNYSFEENIELFKTTNVEINSEINENIGDIIDTTTLKDDIKKIPELEYININAKNFNINSEFVPCMVTNAFGDISENTKKARANRLNLISFQKKFVNFNSVIEELIPNNDDKNYKTLKELILEYIFYTDQHNDYLKDSYNDLEKILKILRELIPSEKLDEIESSLKSLLSEAQNLKNTLNEGYQLESDPDLTAIQRFFYPISKFFNQKSIANIEQVGKLIEKYNIKDLEQEESQLKIDNLLNELFSSEEFKEKIKNSQFYIGDVLNVNERFKEVFYEAIADFINSETILSSDDLQELNKYLSADEKINFFDLNIDSSKLEQIVDNIKNEHLGLSTIMDKISLLRKSLELKYSKFEKQLNIRANKIINSKTVQKLNNICCNKEQIKANINYFSSENNNLQKKIDNKNKKVNELRLQIKILKRRLNKEKQNSDRISKINYKLFKKRLKTLEKRLKTAEKKTVKLITIKEINKTKAVKCATEDNPYNRDIATVNRQIIQKVQTKYSNKPEQIPGENQHSENDTGVNLNDDEDEVSQTNKPEDDEEDPSRKKVVENRTETLLRKRKEPSVKDEVTLTY